MMYISDHYSYSVFIDHSAELIGTLSIMLHLSQNLNWCDIDIYSPFSGFKWEYLQNIGNLHQPETSSLIDSLAC